MNNDIDRHVENPDNYRFAIFYYNPGDQRIIVPKRNRMMGWTLNFGRTNTYLIIAGIIIIVYLAKFYLQ